MYVGWKKRLKGCRNARIGGRVLKIIIKRGCKVLCWKKRICGSEKVKRPEKYECIFKLETMNDMKSDDNKKGITGVLLK